MKIALLSRGPSLSKTMPLEKWRKVAPGAHSAQYDKAVGVLNVGDDYWVDWVVCRDWDAFCTMTPTGDPSWAVNVLIGQNIVDFHTPQKAWTQHHPSQALTAIPSMGINRWEILRRRGKLFFQDAMLFPISKLGADRNWYSFSGTAALGTAFWLIHQDYNFDQCLQTAPHQIDCYGVDLEGESDHLGNPNATREPERWEIEKRIWGGMVDFIERYGVKVNRITKPLAGPA